MKKLLQFAFISFVTFIPQLHSISLAAYIQQNGMPQVQADGSLNLSNLNLTDLTGLRDIPNINQVIVLDLSGNQLQTLPANIFNGLNNLQRLALQNNQLQTLPANIFNDPNNLTHLFLDNNQLQTLPGIIFNNLQNLKFLDLNDNQLQTLPATTFNGLQTLKILHLNNNQLQTLPATIFNGLQNLKSLFLYNNQLQTLPANIFNALNNLKFLELRGNQLQTLPETIFNGLNRLSSLYLQGNPFTPDFIPTLNNIIRNIPNLKTLNDKPKDQALKEQPFVTLKTIMAENIAKNLDAYRPRLHTLPSEVLDLLPLTPQERAEIEQKRAAQ